MIPSGFAKLYLDTLYGHSNGRIHSTWQRSAPGLRVHFLRTPTANAWLISSALPEDIARRIEDLCAAEPVQPDPRCWEPSEPGCIAAIRDLLPSSSESPTESRGPAFEFPAALPAPAWPVELIEDFATVVTAPELDWIRTEPVSSAPLVVARAGDQRIAAVCHTPAQSEEAANAGVETALASRGRGLGAATVLGWARVVRGSGRVPLYGTSWENAASRGIARRLGLTLAAEDWHIG